MYICFFSIKSALSIRPTLFQLVEPSSGALPQPANQSAPRGYGHLPRELCQTEVKTMVRIMGVTPFETQGFQEVGRQNFPNPVWAAGPNLHGFFQAPAAYRLAIANDRARAQTPLEGPMVPLDPPSPDLSYDRRRDRAHGP